MRAFTGIGILICGLASLGCAPHPHAAGQIPITRGERLAILPLDNLTDSPDASRRYTQILFDAIGGRGAFELVPLADVDKALAHYRVRRTDMMDTLTVRSIGIDLKARYILAGTVLDYSEPSASSSGQAEIAVSIRIQSVAGGRILWTCMDARSGSDGEGPFGWGVTHRANKLAQKSAQQIVENIIAALRY